MALGVKTMLKELFFVLTLLIFEINVVSLQKQLI